MADLSISLTPKGLDFSATVGYNARSPVFD
jgi:hypothetical protein